MKRSSCRKYRFILPLVVGFLLSFNPLGIGNQAWAAVVNSVSCNITKEYTDAFERESFEKITDAVAVKAIVKHVYHKSAVKYSKKFKRISSTSPGIRQPVRELEAIEFNTNGRYNYVQPIFLSHLHSFLFRFTPF